jgi:hypothetical protein
MLDYRKPNLFRLTYKHTNRSGPTHEWKKIAADDVAIIARRARGARREIKTPVPGNAKTQWRKPSLKTPIP